MHLTCSWQAQQERITLDPKDVATTAMKPLDFVLPGIIGMCTDDVGDHIHSRR